MKRMKISDEGLALERINYSNAFSYITKFHDTAIAVLYSYETPIMIVKYKRGRVYVELNESAYNYSRTTSKHISQWISILHLFTCWGGRLPWSFKDIATRDYELTFGEFAIPINTEELEVWVISEETLRSECKILAATKSDIVDLADIARM